jgi:hypothetical protein
LLKQLNPGEDTQNVADYTMTDAPSKDDPGESEFRRQAPRTRLIDRVRQPVSLLFKLSGGSADSESHLRALRLIARLGQPFRAFLLAQQQGGEYRRIASDYDIIAQVQDIASIHKMMGVRTVEIL